jgi:3'(2'), 5'-bisphosphate nucleotidase
MKSSLNFVLLQLENTMVMWQSLEPYEWDIAAGHAILVSSGGTITDFNGKEILYGKEDLKNPSLILKSKNIS